MISEQDLGQIFRVNDEWQQLSRDQQIMFNELCSELEEAARDARSTLPPGARQYIMKLVDAAPPLAEEQMARLRVLLPDPLPATPLTRKALQERLRQRTKDWPPLTAEQQETLATVLRRDGSSSQNP
jgi:hypothetical protein